VTGDLQGFAPDARRAVSAAESEARELGHGRVGTEHLLLGLLRDEASVASAVLLDAGATLAAARRKVREAVGSAAPPGDGALTLTPRASRALGRAARFSHARRAPAVGSEHLLEGVLDVEGTAGQVLRGLGVDVERVRGALDPDAATRRQPPASAPVAAPPAVCPSCRTKVDGSLTWHTATATSVDGGAVRDAIVFSCSACGETLGVAPA
jgi:ATP-dependent Clp protease ATP-binding subunit ClpA